MFRYLWPKVIDQFGMQESYDRERQALPIFNDMSDKGLRVNRAKLGKDLKIYKNLFNNIEEQIQYKLGMTFDIGSPKQLGDVLEKTNSVNGWEYTEKGNKSTSRENLIKHIKDPKLVELLSSRGLLSTYINTFMEPWYEKSKSTGRIYPSFNQVRATGEFVAGSAGTRTGRPSSYGPNLFNVPRNLDEDWQKEMPWMRSYIIPDEGCVFLNRDYSQQELRILAHFENDEMLEAYNENPKMDIHDFAQELILQKTGAEYPRKHIKVTAFGIVYGMGIQKLADRLKIAYEEARDLKNAYLKAFPGIRNLSTEITEILTSGEPIRTWGGRIYYEEIDKKYGRDLKYKMMNYAIQGSAADCTKQAMVNVVDNCKDSRLTLQVYDEIMINTPKGKEKVEMQRMKEAMESIQFDVPMLSDGKKSARSWGAMRSYM
jgi:DNA polymerase-1